MKTLSVICAICMGAVISLASPAYAQDFSRTSFTQVCKGASALSPDEIVAERILPDGRLRYYTVKQIPEMVEDFVRIATTEYGWSEDKARSDPFGNIQLAQTELCGGTKDCGRKDCRSNNQRCVYRNIGMTGCRCERTDG